ncbi:hypothetical protein [Streptomyces sp. enrichment culture]|uniref:hypothetical protein n=1 Tax=Streptomyces sp. enrichment culture TaxID=1795815 RepID=UPI003F555705
MTDLAMVARGHIGAGRSDERLTCHPRLPLVACSDAERPAVHIWEFGGGELRDQLQSWSRHSIALGSRPDVLWIATPAGTPVEMDLETRQAVEHQVLPGSRLSALAAAATGELPVAGSGGELVLLSAVRLHPEPHRGQERL